MDMSFESVYSAEKESLKAVLPLDAVEVTMAMSRVMANLLAITQIEAQVQCVVGRRGVGC